MYCMNKRRGATSCKGVLSYHYHARDGWTNHCHLHKNYGQSVPAAFFENVDLF